MIHRSVPCFIYSLNSLYTQGDPTAASEWGSCCEPSCIRRLPGGRVGLGHDGPEADRRDLSHRRALHQLGGPRLELLAVRHALQKP